MTILYMLFAWIYTGPGGKRHCIREGLINCCDRAGIFARSRTRRSKRSWLVANERGATQYEGRKGPAPLGFRPQGHICRVSRLAHRMAMALRREPRICALVDRNAIRIN